MSLLTPILQLVVLYIFVVNTVPFKHGYIVHDGIHFWERKRYLPPTNPTLKSGEKTRVTYCYLRSYCYNSQNFIRHSTHNICHRRRLSVKQAHNTLPYTPTTAKGSPYPIRIPVVEDGKMDIVSRLLKDRILLLGNEVNDEVANGFVAQLLYLDSVAKSGALTKDERDIRLYINSPGGSVTAGIAIFDAMQYVSCDIQTVVFGLAASMGAFLLAAGTRGKRYALPNARIMIHQPLGGAHGQAADIEIQAKEILYTKALLNRYMAHMCQQSEEKIETDCDRDFFMTPQEAKNYGIIDHIIPTKISHIKLPTVPPLLQK